MPVKRTKKRKVTKVSSVKRASKTSRKKTFGSKKLAPTKNKFKIILKNLISFAVLFILSLIAYGFSSANTFLSDVFWFSALITGVITLAFIISYAVFFFLKVFSK